MAFYTFRQNNTGGVYDSTADVDEVVVIEADTADEANDIVCSVGAYFNGVKTGDDCDCCGDRWAPVEEEDGEVVPTLYSRPLGKFVPKRSSGCNVVIHYQNGKRAYGTKPKYEWNEATGEYEWRS